MAKSIEIITDKKINCLEVRSFMLGFKVCKCLKMICLHFSESLKISGKLKQKTKAAPTRKSHQNSSTLRLLYSKGQELYAILIDA